MSVSPVFNRTRIAPTPSGFLHLGNVLSFAITAALARKTGAAIFLRIDDMDQERVQPEFIRDIFTTLQFLGIPWEEGPVNELDAKVQYSQMLRLPVYLDALNRLAEEGHVFACRCSRAELTGSASKGYPGTCRDKNIPLDSPNVNWRLKTTSTILQIRTWPGISQQHTLPDEMKDFVIRKKDGFPAYQLTSVADDDFYGTDLAVRGQDLWHSTLAQVYLSSLLDNNSFNQCTFFHHPLLMDSGNKKLSKSAGDTSIQFLRENGHTPQQIFSTIARLMAIDTAVNDWQSLGEVMIEKYSQN